MPANIYWEIFEVQISEDGSVLQINCHLVIIDITGTKHFCASKSGKTAKLLGLKKFPNVLEALRQYNRKNFWLYI